MASTSGERAANMLIVPGGPPMHLTATGTTQRRSLVLILHESSKPATTLVKGWDPEGLVQELSASARPSAGQVCALVHKRRKKDTRVFRVTRLYAITNKQSAPSRRWALHSRRLVLRRER